MSLVTAELTKRYGAKWALQGLNFSAQAGALTLLAGRNGAGKTTWMRVALGLAHPTSGSVQLGGMPVDRCRGQIAVTFDEAALYPHLTGEQNLCILSGKRSLASSGEQWVLETLQLDQSFLRMRASACSFGQKKRLALGAALLRQPACLLLDEPSVGLDPLAWDLVRTSLQAAAARGVTVVLTGQDLNAMEEIVDHVVVVNGGRAVFDGSLVRLQNQRPPRVRLKSAEADRLREALPEALAITTRASGLLEVSCGSRQEAESIVARIQALQLPLDLLEVRVDSLEEAFRHFVGGPEETRAEERAG